MTTIEPPAVPQTDELTWRGLSAGDLESCFTLVSRIQDHDGEHERTTMSELRMLTRQSWVDLAADALAGVDADGVFRAIGRNVFRPGDPGDAEEHMVTLVGGVDPDWRGRGLGRALLAWQQSRAVQNVAALRAADTRTAGRPARIGCFVEDQIVGRARMFERAGFAPTRWFKQMRLPLSGGVPAPGAELPAGLRLEGFGDELAERVRLAHNDAFRDHWGSEQHSVESWRTELLESADFRPEQSFGIVDASVAGEPVVAYVLNFECTADWEAQGFSEGYIGMLGVLRPWRGRGLARRLLDLSAGVFAARGHRFAALSVDADNPTGAVGLYESLGYVAAHAATYYAIEA